LEIDIVELFVLDQHQGFLITLGALLAKVLSEKMVPEALERFLKGRALERG
jgi:hypothetical protein